MNAGNGNGVPAVPRVRLLSSPNGEPGTDPGLYVLNTDRARVVWIRVQRPGFHMIPEEFALAPGEGAVVRGAADGTPAAPMWRMRWRFPEEGPWTEPDVMDFPAADPPDLGAPLPETPESMRV